jgi:predicted HicB family RNase H-like nuclease
MVTGCSGGQADLSWLANYAGPTVFVGIATGVWLVLIKVSLDGKVKESIANQKEAHDKELQRIADASAAELEDRKKAHAKELEAFKQQFLELEAERSRKFTLLLEEERHSLARALEAAKARISRNEHWFAQELDALVDLNKLYWSLFPEIEDPHPEMSDVFDSIVANREEHKGAIRELLDAFEVFMPEAVVESLRRAQSQLAFSQFGASEQPHIDGSGERAYQLVQGAREAMRDHIDARRREEVATP